MYDKNKENTKNKKIKFSVIAVVLGIALIISFSVIAVIGDMYLIENPILIAIPILGAILIFGGAFSPIVKLMLPNIRNGMIFKDINNFIFVAPNKLLKEGQKTVGKIVNITQTGTRINDQPLFIFEINHTINGQVYIGKARQVVPEGQIHLFNAGMSLPICYDRNDPSKIAIDLNGDRAEYEKILANEMVKKGVLDPSLVDLKQTGQKGKVLILASEPTGKIIDDYTEFKLKIKVFCNTGSEYETEVNKFIRAAYATHYAVGNQLEAFYDPYNEKRVVMTLPA